MTISTRTRKQLWGRSGNHCSFDGCTKELIIEVEETGKDVVISNEAHIVAHGDEGPRAAPAMPIEERDSYSNLMLLCLEHHQMVDVDPDHWTVERLREMKARHEAEVRARMSSQDKRELELDVAYASIVTDWTLRGRTDDWSAVYQGLLAPTPNLTHACEKQIDDTRLWLLNRMWPGTRPTIDAAFETMRRVMDDLGMVIDCWFREWRSDRWHRPVYKDEWIADHAFFVNLEQRASWIVDIVHDLVFEMTRSANQVIFEVSLDLDPTFRRAEGLLTLERMGSGMYFERFVPRYASDSFHAEIYGGLRSFATDRQTRTIWFGSGFNDAAYRDITPIRATDD